MRAAPQGAIRTVGLPLTRLAAERTLLGAPRRKRIQADHRLIAVHETKLKLEYDQIEMNTPNRIADKPTHDEIALSAFLAWENEGRPPGRDTIHWLNAEAQLCDLHRLRTETAAPVAARTDAPRSVDLRPRATTLAPTKPESKSRNATRPGISVKPAAASRTKSARRAV